MFRRKKLQQEHRKHNIKENHKIVEGSGAMEASHSLP